VSQLSPKLFSIVGVVAKSVSTFDRRIFDVYISEIGSKVETSTNP
jgi:hypothetical protein